MPCQDVGATNPDIAGVGIVIGFAFPAGISLILSIWSLFYWEAAVASILNPGDRPASLHPGFVALARIVFHDGFSAAISQLKNHTDTRLRMIRSVREADIISTEYNGRPHNTDIRLGPLHIAYKGHWQQRKKIIDQILVTISDMQTFNALSLLIAALIQYKSMSLYHLHIVYDTVSFTGVSVCASLVNIFAEDSGRRASRLISLMLLVCAYLSFAAVFGKRLEGWDEDVAGRCYHTQWVAYPSHPHPLVDRVYLGLTSFWFLSCLFACLVSHIKLPPDTLDQILDLQQNLGKFSMVTSFSEFSALLINMAPHEVAPAIVIWSMLQYPLHLYMVIAMRVANEGLLSGDSENNWGFGQIFALILSIATIMECIRGISQYRKFKSREADRTTNGYDLEQDRDPQIRHRRRRRSV